jgi:hypothetical protein
MAVANRKTNTLSSVVDYWNAAYRGLVPGGINQVPPEYTDTGPDPEPIDQPDDPYVNPDPLIEVQQNIVPIPVVITDDISHTRIRVAKEILTYTQQILSSSSYRLVTRVPYTTQIILQNLGPGIVYLGHNESVGTSGFQLPVGQLIVLGTTRDVWAIQQTGQSGYAQVCVIHEYDKDTTES